MKISAFAAMAAFCAGAVTAQTTTLVRLDTPVTPPPGVDFRVNQTHYTYDLRIRTGSLDWTGSEVAITVGELGRLWHAPGQRIATRPHPSGDPNQPECDYHNLLPPGIVANADNAGDLIFRDTFFTAPGQRFTVDPLFTSPGAPNPDPTRCGDSPIVSTPNRIRGRNIFGQEIPLVWYDLVNAPLNNTVMARFTFEVSPLVQSIETTPGPNRFLLADIVGRSTHGANPEGNPFTFRLYAQVPEPSSMVLACAGAVLMLGFRLRR